MKASELILLEEHRLMGLIQYVHGVQLRRLDLRRPGLGCRGAGPLMWNQGPEPQPGPKRKTPSYCTVPRGSHGASFASGRLQRQGLPV